MSSTSTPSLALSNGSTESMRESSQLKRTPPPSIFRYSAAELQDPLAQVWELLRKKATGDSEISSEHPFSDDIREFWNNLLDSDSDSGENTSTPKVVHQRPRASSVPSSRMSTIRRVLPIDIDMLASTRNLGALRPVSLPQQQFIHVSDRAARVLSQRSNDSTPLSQLSPQVAAESDVDNDDFAPAAADVRRRLQRETSIRKKSTTGRSNNVSFASVSAPVLVEPPLAIDKKYSVISMASTMTSSMVPLSAFPQPADNVPPVAEVPLSDLFTPARPTLAASRPYATEVKPTLMQKRTPRGRDPSSTRSEGSPSLTVALRTPALAKGKAPTASISIRRDGPAAHFDSGEPLEYDGFDETRLPFRRQLEEAAALPIISESGVRVPFGNLFAKQKTIVCFIRHFWCSFCQDYMFAISQNVSPEVLDRAGISLIIVSNGSYEMIKSYRRIFRTPFAVYTDPTHKVYNALGMTLRTMESGPRGSYIRHSLVGGIGMVVKNAVKVGTPVWKHGGDIAQLGGEFILGPGLSCSWAHRMRYTRAHVPILQVIEAAGVDMHTPLQQIARTTGGSFLGMSSAEESKWMERRRKTLEKLRGKKMSRHGGTQLFEITSTATSVTTRRSPEGNKRSRVRSSTTGEWDVATEEALNIGLMGYKMVAIEKAEEEERAEAEAEQEQDREHRGPVDSVPEPHSVNDPNEASAEPTDNAPLELGYDSESSSSHEDGVSSATEMESRVDGEPVVEVSFSLVDVRFTREDRSTDRSSLGSGYEDVVEYHGVFFTGVGEKMGTNLAASLSDSSLGSF